MPPPSRAKADEVRRRVLVGLVEARGQDPEVPRDPEQAEADDQQSRDRPGRERYAQRGRDASLRGLCRPHIGPNGHVHADEARSRGQHRADQEADRRAPAKLVPEADHEEEHGGDGRDRRVLTAQVRRRALLHCARDLLHPLGAGGESEQPCGQHDAIGDRQPGADERNDDRVLIEEFHRGGL
jgi:hypothetical protein